MRISHEVYSILTQYLFPVFLFCLGYVLVGLLSSVGSNNDYFVNKNPSDDSLPLASNPIRLLFVNKPNHITELHRLSQREIEVLSADKIDRLMSGGLTSARQ